MRLVQLNPTDIISEGRIRKSDDRAKAVALMRSMDKLGQLQPIGVRLYRGKHYLVLGQRRLDASVMLGWETINAVILDTLDDATKLLEAERDENECREPLTASEAVAMAERIRKLKQPAPAPVVSTPPQYPFTPLSEPPPPVQQPIAVAQVQEPQKRGRGRPRKDHSRTDVAKSVGLSHESLRKASVVVEAATQQPELFGPVRQQMDETGNVDAAYKQVRQLQGEPPPDERAIILRDLERIEARIRTLTDINVDKAIERLAQLRAVINGRKVAEARKPADDIERQAAALWAEYPRRDGKAAAIKAICKALADTPFETLLAAVEQYRDATRGEDLQFIPQPSRWFNERRWEDDRSLWGSKNRDNRTSGLDAAVKPAPSPPQGMLFEGEMIHDDEPGDLPY